MDTRQYYDVTEKQKRIALWRDAKRKELRAMYLKDAQHPTKSLLFDTGLFRYGAVKTVKNRFYIPQLVDFAGRTALVLVPIFSLWWYLETTKGAKERMYRTGQVSYADRHPKFL